MKLVILLVLICFLNNANADLLDKVKESIQGSSDLVKSFCILDDQCNTAFLNINNYCCTVKCCNMFEYVSNDDKYWDNMIHTFKVPRPINIIIFVAIILALASVIGIIVKLICCLCCGCCGSKKYVIVGRGGD